MFSRLLVALTLLPALGLTQPSDPITNQKIIEELRGVRTSMEKLEKGQNALVALARIQVDESRVAVLEAQRLQLLSREQDLEKRMAGNAAAIPQERPGAVPTLVQAVPDGSQRIVQAVPASPAADRFTESPQRLEEVRRSRQAIEQSIAGLRKRIALWEKYLDDVLR